MDAGRELDARIARDVLDWQDVEYIEDDWYGVSPSAVAAHVAQNAAPFEVVPCYSTDHGDVLAVIGALGARGFGMAYSRTWCQLQRVKQGQLERHEATGASGPHAICLAALKVAEWKAEEE